MVESIATPTVGQCYYGKYLMLGYILIHVPYWYFNIYHMLIILDNGSNKESKKNLSRGSTPDLWKYSQVVDARWHCWIFTGGQRAVQASWAQRLCPAVTAAGGWSSSKNIRLFKVKVSEFSQAASKVEMVERTGAWKRAKGNNNLLVLIIIPGSTPAF